MKKVIFLFILSITISSIASAQTVSATLNKEKILIGERLQLYLKSVSKRAVAGQWFSIDTIPHFEILERSKIDSQQTSEGLFLQQTITFTSWDSGTWAFPSFRLGTAKTTPLVITVGYSPMDPNQPYHDIKQIIEVQKPGSSNWYWYLLGIAVLIALFMLFFPPKEKKETPKAAVPEEDAYAYAIRRLDALRVNGDSKQLFTELIDIFRIYLANRKGIQSFSKTTDDLARQVGGLGLPSDQYNRLVQTLQASDMVKFAKYQPQDIEKEESVDVIRKNIMAIENTN
jgi:hypothetical protein